MQIVLSGNRVMAHGDSCFLSMGGTVICEETGKAYPNATIAEVDALPADIDSVGYEYHAGVFVPCAPYGRSDDGYIMVSCNECGTPRVSSQLLNDLFYDAYKAINSGTFTISLCTQDGTPITTRKGEVILYTLKT